jgi:hypothetical protein
MTRTQHLTIIFGLLFSFFVCTYLYLVAANAKVAEFEALTGTACLVASWLWTAVAAISRKI